MYNIPYPAYYWQSLMQFVGLEAPPFLLGGLEVTVVVDAFGWSDRGTLNSSKVVADTFHLPQRSPIPGEQIIDPEFWVRRNAPLLPPHALGALDITGYG